MYISDWIYALFLFRQEKAQKKPTKGWLFTKTPPFRIPLLNQKSYYFASSRQKCADFCPAVTEKSIEFGRAGRAAAPAVV